MNGQDTERELIQRILKGETRLFTDIVRRYENLVYRIIRPLCQNPADCEDLFQEIFLRVYQHLHRFRGESSLGTWIARIAYRKALDSLSRKKRHAIAIAPEETALGQKVVEHTGEFRLMQQELREQVMQAVDQLPFTYRTIVLLYHVERYSYQQIAEVLDMPLGTLKSYLFRARKILKERLQPLIEE